MKVVYVVNELASSVSVVDLNKDGGFTILETVSALPSGYNKPNTCADIHISKDGRFLYASNRGCNSIAIFSVDPKNGKITQIAQESTRGESPRNFTLSPDEDYLLVANQVTQDIVAFRRDKNTGKLLFTDQVKAFKPVCLLFRK
jgi:6-phosphogluconolactonase